MKITLARTGLAKRFMAVLAVATMSTTCTAQLQITEVMYNSVQEPKWEWVEVRNNGGSPVDLDGYYFDDNDDNALLFPNLVNVNSGGNSSNTLVPANGVAVIYNGSSLDFDDSRFRAAWNLAANIPLIAAASPPGLANGGDVFGIWTPGSYTLDIADPDMDGFLNVVQFTNAAATVDYGNGFPTGIDRSIYWNGVGNYADGTQWLTSEDGLDGATTSVRTFQTMTQINNTADTANPGLVPAGGAASGLLISEIMYNPASAEDDWEWVEVYNNTNAVIDFASNPYVLDDDDLGPLSEANVTTGSIPIGGVAILYNDDISAQNVADAWGAANNYIPVANWPGLANGSDVVGIWDDFNTYEMDEANMVLDGAVATASYTDAPPFPFDNGSGSIYLSSLTADPVDGANWLLSDPADGISFNASPAIDGQEDHPGGDIGSPGFFGSMPPTPDGDFNNDGMYDCADVDALVAVIVAGSNAAAFDLTGDGSVDNADLAAWLVEGGNAEIGAPFLAGDANLDGVVDVPDFNAWNNNKFTSNPGWCNADFNADGVVDVPDFNIWNNNKFQSSSPAAVPEPAILPMMLAILAAFSAFRRHDPA